MSYPLFLIEIPNNKQIFFFAFSYGPMSFNIFRKVSSYIQEHASIFSTFCLKNLIHKPKIQENLLYTKFYLHKLK